MVFVCVYVYSYFWSIKYESDLYEVHGLFISYYLFYEQHVSFITLAFINFKKIHIIKIISKPLNSAIINLSNCYSLIRY